MSPFRPVEEQLALLMRGVEFGDETTRTNMEQELRMRLAESRRDDRPLRVYCGFDPTASDLHLGHTVPMRKLAQFQELGHEVIFLIGTYTSLIGDPSDKTSARRQQTEEQARDHAKTFTDQAWKVLDPDRTLIMYNGEWLSKLMFKDIIGLASNFTVQQFLARDNFRQRYEAGQAIQLHEFFYALMQAYDAVAQEADVQVGGQDQLFNIVVAGRKLQQALGQRPQVAIIMGESLPGTDGEIKMSKSLGNHIPIMAAPEDMYGKLMSVPDHAMPIYYKLVLGWSPAQISRLEADLAGGQAHPRDIKMALAREIVTIFHSAEAAQAAEQDFIRKFQERGIPEEIPTERLAGAERVVDLLERLGMAPSKGEAKRLIRNGGVRLDGEPIEDIGAEITPADLPAVLQVGRRKFMRLEKA